MNKSQSLYVNGQTYDLVLKSNAICQAFVYDAYRRSFIKGNDYVDPRDVSMYREA